MFFPTQTNDLSFMIVLQVGYSSPSESGIEDDLGLTSVEVRFN